MVSNWPLKEDSGTVIVLSLFPHNMDEPNLPHEGSTTIVTSNCDEPFSNTWMEHDCQQILPGNCATEVRIFSLLWQMPFAKLIRFQKIKPERYTERPTDLKGKKFLSRTSSEIILLYD